MEMLIPLLILLAIIAIVWWAITKMNLPQPMQIVAVVFLAIVAIIVLLNYMPAGGHLHLAR